MAKLLKLRRGSTSQHSSFTGAEGEVTVDTDKDVLVVNDGSTAGGHPLAAEDMSNVSSASIAGRLATDSIATTKIAGGALPTDVTVASANIVDGTIVNADVNASAAIAGTKIAPDFGSQNLSTTGNLSGAALTLSNNNLIINGTQPNISFVDSDANPDYLIKVNGGTFDIRDNTSDSSMFSIGSGELAAQGKLNCQAGLDTDGDVVLNSGSTNVNVTFDASTSNMKFSDSMSQSFGDHSTTGDYSLTYVNGSDFTINAMQGGSGDLVIGRYENAAQKKHIVSTRAGVAELYHDNSKKLNTAAGGVDVTGNITVSGTVDGVDVALLNTNAGSFFANGSGLLVNGVTATTQSASDNSTKVATTAYTDTAISNLVDSSPSTLNTLNELAAALGDDANFSTTVTNSIATKMPLAGGTFTGDITCSGGAGAISVSGDSDIRLTDGSSWTGDFTGGIKLQPYSTDSYFQYKGSLYFRDTAGNNRLTLDSSGNLTAAANVTAYSDASLKENVKTIDNALSIVGKLRGVSYNWNNKFGIGSHADIGVIAQEVETVLPEIVKINNYKDPQYPEDQTEIKSVDYGKLTSVLINAINELKAEVDALKGGS